MIGGKYKVVTKILTIFYGTLHATFMEKNKKLELEGLGGNI